MTDFLNKETQEEFNKEPDDDLVSGVADRLSKLSADNEDEDEDVGLEDLKEELDLDDDEDKDEDEDEGKDEDDEDTDKDKDDDEVVISEAYLRAAKHQGWTEDEVKELYESNPEVAKRTMEKIYESTNYITQQTADLGRAHQKQLQQAAEAEADKQDKPAYKRVDVENLRKKYEDAPELVDVIEAIDKQGEQMFDAMQELKSQTPKGTERQATQEEAKLFNKMETFFEGEANAGYDEFYGKTKSGQEWGEILTGNQMQNRVRTVEQADAIYAGFELRGKSISYEEALERAHLIVSKEVRESAIREDIGKKVKKRSQGITVKSSGKKSKVSDEDSDAPPKDSKKRESWMEKRARKRMQKTLGGAVN